MDFYIVDAFSKKPFGGNAAGVVVYEDLSPEMMQKLAAELRFSETAFIKQINPSTYSIRFFTPTNEIDLCGHATLASFTALKEGGHIVSNGTYSMKTGNDMLPISVSDDFIMMEQASPIIRETLSSTDAELLANIFNIPVHEIGDISYDLVPQIASTGVFDIMLPVKSREVLQNLNANFIKLAEFSKEKNVVGVHAFTLDCDDHTACCRNFAPLYGIDEEPATGTSNGALTYYLYMNKVIKDLYVNYTFLQGEKMDRPSIIVSQLRWEDKIKVLVGGSCYVLSKGRLNL